MLQPGAGVGLLLHTEITWLPPWTLTELLWGATWLAGLFKASWVNPLCSKAGTGPMKGVIGKRCLRGEPAHLGPGLGGDPQCAPEPS